MAINATNTAQQRELIPAGNYIARCYSMVHIGTSLTNVLGEEKIMNKVNITWELPDEMRVFNEEKGEQPMVISKEYTLSMHEKSNLRRDLESWRGKSFTENEANMFDITKLLGVPCMLNIIHHTAKNGNVYEKISGITNIPKSMECPPQINETFEFNFDDKFDNFDKLNDYMKNKVKESDEYKLKIQPENNQIKEDDFVDTEEVNDLPF